MVEINRFFPFRDLQNLRVHGQPKGLWHNLSRLNGLPFLKTQVERNVFSLRPMRVFLKQIFAPTIHSSLTEAGKGTGQ